MKFLWKALQLGQRSFAGMGAGMGRWQEYAKLAALFALTILAAFVAAFLLVHLALIYSPPRALSFKDCMDVAQVAITGLGLASLALLWKQLRDSSRWNKLLTYHKFFSNFPDEEVVKSVREALREHQQDHILRDKGAYLPEKVAKVLFEQNQPDGSKRAIDCYLDAFETFCAAIHGGLISEDYAYGIEGGRVIKNYLRFRSYIEIAQGINRRAFIQFQQCAERWQKRRASEDSDVSGRSLLRHLAP